MNAATQLLKRWTTVRARGCRVGVLVFRSDPADGARITYFAVRHGFARTYPDLEALEDYVRGVEQVVA